MPITTEMEESVLRNRSKSIEEWVTGDISGGTRGIEKHWPVQETKTNKMESRVKVGEQTVAREEAKKARDIINKSGIILNF